MGRIVVTEFVSLDGVMEAPGGGEDFEHGGWTFEIERGEDGNRFKLDELGEADVQLLGRRTYEGFAAACPRAARVAGGGALPDLAGGESRDEASVGRDERVGHRRERVGKAAAERVPRLACAPPVDASLGVAASMCCERAGARRHVPELRILGIDGDRPGV